MAKKKHKNSDLIKYHELNAIYFNSKNNKNPKLSKKQLDTIKSFFTHPSTRLLAFSESLTMNNRFNNAKEESK